MNQKFVKYLMLSKSDITLMAAGTVINEPSDLTEGQLAIVNSANTTVVADQTGTAPYLVRVVQRVGDELIFSPWIDASKLRKVSAVTGVKSTEQVSFVGYNGTSGSLGGAPASIADYILKGIIKNTKTTYNCTPFIAHWSYQAAASATEQTIAAGLLTSFNTWAKRFPEKVLACELVAATTSVAAFTGSSTIIKVTNGSKSVATYIKAAAGNVTLTASTASVVTSAVVNIPSWNGRTFTFSAVALGSGAGRHVVYIGGTTYNVADAGTDAQNATAIAASINAGTQATASVDTAALTITYNEGQYFLPPMVLSSDDDSTFSNVAVTIASGDAIPVKYINGAATSAAATFTLATEWQGPTGYVYEGTTAATNAGITTLNGDDFGLKFTGKALPVNFEKRNYEKVRFELGLDGDFPTAALVTDSVAASEGIGVYAQIGTLERQAQMNEGQAWLSAYPSVNYRNETAKMAAEDFPLYQTIVDFYDDAMTPVLGDTVKSYATVIIATPNATGHGLIGDVFGI